MAGYVKLFSSILDSTIWQTPVHVKVVWITMLAMADKDGEVQASVPGLALRAGVERSQCEQALAILSAPDPDSRTKTADGRRIEAIDGGWALINHAVYRNKLSAEDKREKDRERQRRHRASQPSVTEDVTPECDSHAMSVESRPVTTSEASPSPSASPNHLQIQNAREKDPPGVELLSHLYAEWRRVHANAPGTGSVETLAKVWRGEPAPTHAVRAHLERVKLVIEAALGETDPKAWLTRTIEGFSRDPYARQKAAGFDLYASKPGNYAKAAQVLSSAPSNFDHAPGPDADLPACLGGPE